MLQKRSHTQTETKRTQPNGSESVSRRFTTGSTNGLSKTRPKPTELEASQQNFWEQNQREPEPSFIKILLFGIVFSGIASLLMYWYFWMFLPTVWR